MPFPLYKVPKVKRLLRLEPEHAKTLKAKLVDESVSTTETDLVTEVAPDEK